MKNTFTENIKTELTILDFHVKVFLDLFQEIFLHLGDDIVEITWKSYMKWIIECLLYTDAKIHICI